MKFDFVIGNPPYQDNTLGDNLSYAPPIYHNFFEEAMKIADKVELISPARFLFNAGSTPKEWNAKMLNNKHVKILSYEAKSKNVFANTDIKGGIAITYIDKNQDYGKIGIFTAFEELNSIVKRISKYKFESLDTIIYASEIYKFSEIMHHENPNVNDLLSEGHRYDLKSSVQSKLNNIIFFDDMPDDGNEYVQIIGIRNLQRTISWIKRKYLNEPDNFTKYKVFVPAANGSGAIGEVLSTPLIGQPLIGHTQSFISIGNFDKKEEASACLKYIKTKFARTMLGVLKVTQSNNKNAWKFVPLQDFTSKSDIDWSKSIKEIDKQLYKKYKLSKEEIDFIEQHVKEMN